MQQYQGNAVPNLLQSHEKQPQGLPFTLDPRVVYRGLGAALLNEIIAHLDLPPKQKRHVQFLVLREV